MINVNGGFAGRVQDGDGNFGSAVIARGVGETDFVFAGGLEVGMEGDGFGAFGFVAVVDIASAEKWFVKGGMLPLADQPSLRIIDDNTGERIERKFFGGR